MHGATCAKLATEVRGAISGRNNRIGTCTCINNHGPLLDQRVHVITGLYRHQTECPVPSTPPPSYQSPKLIHAVKKKGKDWINWSNSSQEIRGHAVFTKMCPFKTKGLWKHNPSLPFKILIFQAVANGTQWAKCSSLLVMWSIFKYKIRSPCKLH